MRIEQPAGLAGRAAPAVTASTPATGRGSPPAGVVTRALAFTLDALLLVMAVTGLLGLFGVIGAVLAWEPYMLLQRLAAAFVAGLPALWLGFNAMMWTATGRTPGKALLGVRVTRTDGTPVGLGRAVVRSLGYLVSGILLLGFLWVLVDPGRRAWHDRLAGTVVVYDRRPGIARPT